MAWQEPRIERSPMLGDRVEIPGKYMPHFKAGKESRERMKSWFAAYCHKHNE